MRLRSWITLAATGAACAVTVSCSRDNPVGPPPTRDAAAHSLLGLNSPVTIVPLQRTSPLPANVQTSATIGPLGGTLSLPTAGLTVVVPPLAVMSPTTITVTALAGSNVAYELAPHGTVFLVPVLATQALQGTEAANGGLVDPLALFVGYFPNASQITSVTELLNVSVNLLGQTSTVALRHFSGYVWSSGRTDEAQESGGGTQ